MLGKDQKDRIATACGASAEAPLASHHRGCREELLLDDAWAEEHSRREVFADAFVGVDFGIREDLTGRLPGQWRDFNREFIPVYLAEHPGKSKIAAGLASGTVWTVSRGMATGDILLSPDGTGRYCVGEIAGDYYYLPDEVLPHRRPVRWLDQYVDRPKMSDALRHSTAGGGTVATLTAYQAEIDALIGRVPGPPVLDDQIIEDAGAFALERHLEDFLVENWAHTELGRVFDIYQDDGARIGQQYPTDTGPIDILAMSKDKLRLLVVELKKGRASDAVVGQVLRYMGYGQDVIAEPAQTVQGVIIASADDQRINRALAMVPAVGFYRFEVIPH